MWTKMSEERSLVYTSNAKAFYFWFIVEHFNANHIVLASGQLFQDEEILHQLDNNPNCVVVTDPWSSNHGHVAVLQELHSLKGKAAESN